MKRFVFFVFCLFMTSFLYSQKALYKGIGVTEHKIMFAESILENGIYDKTDVWITDKIKTNLISVLQRYGGFNCIDLAEAKNILKVQKQLESGIYDDSQSIEIGKLIKAKEIVNIKTTRLPSGSYSINIVFLNIESGEILGIFTSPITYDSGESYAIQAHYDCVLDILNRFAVKLTDYGMQSLQNEKKLALEQAEKNKLVAIENAKIEEERSEKAKAEALRRAEIEQAEREKRIAKEKAEAEANRKAIAEKKRREQEIREKAIAEKKRLEQIAYEKALAEKKKNPFANETYSYDFENGSRHDSYEIKFLSQNECSVTVTSVDSKGEEKTFSADGNYSYGNEILSVSVHMPNTQIKHIQKIQWKGQVRFKNEYKTFFLMIPVNSSKDAKKIRAEFQLN